MSEAAAPGLAKGFFERLKERPALRNLPAIGAGMLQQPQPMGLNF